jgi:hypothetical protein
LTERVELTVQGEEYKVTNVLRGRLRRVILATSVAVLVGVVIWICLELLYTTWIAPLTGTIFMAVVKHALSDAPFVVGATLTAGLIRWRLFHPIRTLQRCPGFDLTCNHHCPK